MAKQKSHHLVLWRCGYSLCVGCGLLTLKNERTTRALKAACLGKED